MSNNLDSEKFQLKEVGRCSEQFGNYDVISERSRLGRLYLLPCTEPNLIAVGIEKQWFITHAEGDFVVSGYVNKAGEWSLSNYQSLEPTPNYGSQADVFEAVFSNSYVERVQEQRSSQLKLDESSGELNLAEVLSNSAEPVSVVGKTGNLVSDKNDGEGDGEGNGEIDGKLGNTFSESEMAFLFSLPGIKELLKKSSGLSVGSSADLENADAIAASAASEKLEAKQFAAASVASEDKAKAVEQANEEMRLLAQQRLVELVLAFLSRDDRDDRELKDPDWALVIDSKRHMFVLRDRASGHTVLRATLEGDVLEPLSLEDAREFSSTSQIVELSQHQAREGKQEDLQETTQRLSQRSPQEIPQLQPQGEVLQRSPQVVEANFIIFAPQEQARPELKTDEDKKGLEL